MLLSRNVFLTDTVLNTPVIYLEIRNKAQFKNRISLISGIHVQDIDTYIPDDNLYTIFFQEAPFDINLARSVFISQTESTYA